MSLTASPSPSVSARALSVASSVSLSATSSPADQLSPELFHRRSFAFLTSASSKRNVSTPNVWWTTRSTSDWLAVVRLGSTESWSWPLDRSCTVVTA